MIIRKGSKSHKRYIFEKALTARARYNKYINKGYIVFDLSQNILFFKNKTGGIEFSRIGSKSRDCKKDLDVFLKERVADNSQRFLLLETNPHTLENEISSLNIAQLCNAMRMQTDNVSLIDIKNVPDSIFNRLRKKGMAKNSWNKYSIVEYGTGHKKKLHVIVQKI